MNISAVSSLRIAALAVAALKDLRVTATTDPLYSTDDFSYVGVLCEDGSAWTVKYPRDCKNTSGTAARRKFAL